MYIIVMCMIGMKIKPSSSRAPSKVFVPCGHCAECRKAAQSQWCFRLKAEFLKLQELGWNLGFLTLT
nr:replication initiation protein [Microvirus sp.]CAI9752388.1 replication initiation protein [Microvirus sp.]